MTQMSVPLPAEFGQPFLLNKVKYTMASIDINPNGVFYILVDDSGRKCKVKLNMTFSPVDKKNGDNQEGNILNFEEYTSP